MLRRIALSFAAVAGVCVAHLAACAGAEPRSGQRASTAPAMPALNHEAPQRLPSDDRQEDFEFTDPAWLSRLRASTLALIPAQDLVESKTTVRVVGASLAQAFNVCADVPFAQQPVSAKCSATLIAPDLVLTAGHCTRELACEEARFVFDYAMQSATELATLRKEDVFACTAVLVESVGALDYAVVRLDRPAAPRIPAKVRLFRTPVEPGQRLLFASHPSGLPRKISSRAKVTDARGGAADYFLSDLFTFPGSSGAGVFLRDTGELVGSVIGGLAGTGYSEQREGVQCVHLRPASDRGGEPIHVSYAAAAIAELCRKSPVAALCPCGDGECDGSVSEDSRSCPSDCGSTCGDGTCNGAENGANCYGDCGACGNGVCEVREAALLTCCDDCGCPGAYACGNGACLPALGNVNADASVDAADLRALTATVSGQRSAPFSALAADVDCDGRVTQGDVDSLRKHLGRNHLPLPCRYVQDLSLGATHSCVLLGSGQVRCWGDNESGQVGQGGAPARVPVGASRPLGFSSRVRALAAGGEHTCVLLADETVHCWGSGASGQLGYGKRDNESEARSAPAVSLGGPARAIAAGAQHSCALLVAGQVVCWGDNRAGQLGLGHTQNIGDDETPAEAGRIDLGGIQVQALSLGTTHSCALGKAGEVVCWGSNDAGELGLGHTSRIGDDESPAASGAVQLGAPATRISAGALNTCAVLVTGDLRCWGDNSRGQLGSGTRGRLGDRASPNSVEPIAMGGRVADVAVGIARVCAKYVDGRLRCWGNNSHGQLGLATNKQRGSAETPAGLAPLALGGKVARLSTRADHTCALLDDQTLRCWGENSALQLGISRLDDVGDDETPEIAGEVAFFGSSASEWSFVNRLGLAPRLLVRNATSRRRGEPNIELKLTATPSATTLTAAYQLNNSGLPPSPLRSPDKESAHDTTSLVALPDSPFSNPGLALLEFRFRGKKPTMRGSGRNTNRSSAGAKLVSQIPSDTSDDYSAQDGLGVEGWFTPKRIQVLDESNQVVYGWLRHEKRRNSPAR